jgi:hypothetical protein
MNTKFKLGILSLLAIPLLCGNLHAQTRTIVVNPQGTVAPVTPLNFRTNLTVLGNLRFDDAGVGTVTVGRLTTAERDALSSVPDGTIIYNTTTSTLQQRAGGAWSDVGSGTGDGITDGDKGHIIVSSSGLVWTVKPVFQATNSVLTSLSTNTITGTGTVLLSSTIADLLNEGAASLLYQATNATLTSLSTNTITGTGRIVLESLLDDLTGGSGDALLDAENVWTAANTFEAGLVSLATFDTVAVETDTVTANTWAVGSLQATTATIGGLSVTNPIPITSGGTGSGSAAGARIALGVNPGQHVQAWNQVLDDVVGAGYIGQGAFVRQTAAGEGSLYDGIWVLTNTITSDAVTGVWTNAIPADTTAIYELSALGGGLTNSAEVFFRGLFRNHDGTGGTGGTNVVNTLRSTASMDATLHREGTNVILSLSGVEGENVRYRSTIRAQYIANATTGGDTTPPATPVAEIPASGNTIELTFTKAVTFGAGGSGGWTLVGDEEGAAAMTYSSGDGTETLVYALSRAAIQEEGFAVSYVQPGAGVRDLSNNDLASFSDSAVVNNSLYYPGEDCEDTMFTLTGTTDGTLTIGDTSARRYRATKFITGEDAIYVCAADVQMSRTESPSWNLRVAIYSHDSEGDQPDAQIGTGSSAVAASTLPTSEDAVRFSNISASLSASTTYWMVVWSDSDSALGGSSAQWHRVVSSPGGNSNMSGSAGTSWTSQSTNRRGKFTLLGVEGL